MNVCTVLCVDEMCQSYCCAASLDFCPPKQGRWASVFLASDVCIMNDSSIAWITDSTELWQIKVKSYNYYLSDSVSMFCEAQIEPTLIWKHTYLCMKI